MLSFFFVAKLSHFHVKKEGWLGGTVLWWNSERFVVITRQLQAAKCSLSCQLFRHIFNFLHFNTVTLNVNKRLLDLSALYWAHVSRIFCLISISDH
jgi:hypothetical protein